MNFDALRLPAIVLGIGALLTSSKGQQLLQQLVDVLRCWVVIAPWEQALRVRLGRYTQYFKGGVRFKIPFIDQFYVQSVRLRISDTGKQTVSTAEGRVITFTGAIGYSICDIRRLYDTLHHAEEAVSSIVRAALAHDIVTHAAADCLPDLIAGRVTAALDLTQFGLGNVQVYVTELALVKTYRLIGDSGWSLYSSGLNTRESVGSSSNGTPV